jgi:subfamily B ATP-binding cassette protein HlyB/CyaB
MVMSGALTVGQLVAFSMIVGRLMMPMQRLIQLWQEFQPVRVSVGRLGELLNMPGEANVEIPQPRSLTGHLEFRNICFRHRPDDDWVLDDVCLTINPGEVVGIVGPSGSGKSTVARLLQGLHAPEQGKILVDGIDSRQFGLAWLRRRIAVVAQDAVLFNRSIRGNVTLARPDADDAQVWSALDLAGAADFVRRLPSGIETVLGEGGSTLSGGERQRLAIARALITEPDVLVFDEATSAVDFEAEERLQANMARIAEDRTVVVIAHRLSALRTVDRIVTLREGRVREDGTPANLIRAGGYFSDMVRTQAELMGFRLYREAS